MKLTVQHFGTSPGRNVESMVKQELLALEPLRQIDEARVNLALDHFASPPFSIKVHLVTPGLDVFADARDHTPAAALAKIVKSITTQIKTRENRRVARRRMSPQKRTPSRPGGAL